MSLIPLQPQGCRPPLFLVHGIAGEIAHSFRHVAACFPPDQPLYGLEAHRLFDSIEEMSAEHVQAIRSVQPSGPYQIGGYSFGASSALEICQQLQREGESVRALLVFDHTLPPTRYQANRWTPRSFGDAVANLARWLVISPWEKHNITWSWERIAQRLRQALGRRPGGTARSDADYVFRMDRLPEQVRQYIENHYRILRNYQPRPYPGLVILFRCAVRPLLRTYPPALGWESLVARRRLRVIPIPGDHVSMLRGKLAPVLAAKINQQLAGVATRRLHVPRCDAKAGADVRDADGGRGSGSGV